MESQRQPMGCSTLLAVLLTVLFVGLKLGGVIAWSWFWVLSPLWISVLLGVGVFLLILAVGTAIAYLGAK